MKEVKRAGGLMLQLKAGVQVLRYGIVLLL